MIVNYKVDDAAVRHALQRAHKKTAGLSPLMREIAAALEASTQMRFQTSTGPDGKKWAALATATRINRARRAAGGRIFTKNRRRTTVGFTRAYLGNMQPLLDTGRLRASILSTYNSREVIVGTNVIYARIQQFGGMAGRNRKVKIPARPFFGFSDGDRADIADLVRTFLGEALK
jgi:phage gpG-like protein